MDKREDNPPRSTGENTELTKTKKQTQKNKKNKGKAVIKWGWALKVAAISIAISILMTLLSSEVLEKLNLAVAFVILVIFILINIFFDIIGISVATADIKPFLSMSARRLKVGYTGVYLINNAEKVNNICADVIGDIAGVVSGATGTAIIVKLFTDQNSAFAANLIITSLIAGLTVGGKAIGKSIGMKYSYNFVYGTARVLSIFSRRKTNEKKDLK